MRKFLAFGLMWGHVIWAAVPGAAGNGVTDDTAAIQTAINNLPSNGVLDGGGRTYLVGTLNLKSRMTIENFNLKTRAASMPFTDAITVDGTRTPLSNINIVNVNIDGNRAEQTNLLTAEDGGRSCFRIVGVVTNLWITRSSATNCATDGLEIFSDDVIPPAGTLNFTNVVVTNSQFNNNRRHGASADSLRSAQFIGDTFNGNGLAVNTGSRTPTEGESAYLVNGMLYGAGIDIEGYTVYNGLNGLTFSGVTATGNARFGIQFWYPISPLTPGFTRWANISITHTVADGGVSPQTGHQAIELNGPYIAQGFLYQNVSISSCYIDGTLVMDAVQGLTIKGGQVDSPYPGFWGLSYYSQNITVQGVSAQGKVFQQF